VRTSLLGVAALLVIASPIASADDSHSRKHKTTTRRPREKLSLREAPPTVVAAPIVIEPKPPAPGVTLPQGGVLVVMTLEMSLTADSAAVPASLAPDISGGVTKDLTLSLVHSGAAMTGFRGGAGAGFCFTGEGPGRCKTSYAGGGVEALYSLTRGTFALGANAGILITAVDPTREDIKLGLKSKIALGPTTSIALNPSVWLALNDRNDAMAPHEDQLLLPLGITQKVTKQFSLGVGTGIRGPLKHLGTHYAIPAGVVAQFALDSHVTFGSSFVFGRIVGGDGLMNPDAGTDSRALQMWLSVSSR
jgi:hypothetical protein